MQGVEFSAGKGRAWYLMGRGVVCGREEGPNLGRRRKVVSDRAAGCGGAGLQTLLGHIDMQMSSSGTSQV